MRTKIIATIGPKSEVPDTLERMVEAGFDIARMNFSHCTDAEYRSRKRLLAKFGRKHGKRIAIMQDLQGPRIRVGELPPEGREVREGETIVFSTKREKGNDAIFIDNPKLHKEVRKDEPIYLANGEMELAVAAVKGPRIYANVVRGGVLYSRKAVNVPHTKLSISGLTAKDVRDLRFALREGVDYVAISFVQTAEDVLKAKRIAGSRAKVVAKIETALALRNIDAIIQASDAIMIARGDLGIEVPVETLPFIQKNLIRHAIWHGKPSITATQILTSMVTHPHPTRAEVSDIANAVFDRTDAIMLSDETASGQYPVRALRTAAKVAAQAEAYMNRANLL